MKKFRWQLLIIFLTGIVVGILLLSEQPNSTNRLSPEPAKGGNYTEALTGSIQRLNPILDFNNQVDQDVDRLLFSRLITFDEHGYAVGDLAQSWGNSQDGTVYTIVLNSKAKWHDGKPVTTDDIVYTVNLLKNGGDVVPQDIQDFWKDIEVVKLDDHNLQFKLPEAYAPFLDYLSFGILPSHIFNGMTIDQVQQMNVNLSPIGSGPYQFDQLLLDNGQITGISLKAFSDYYGDEPFIQQIVFRYYADSASAMQAYKDGQVNGIDHVTGDILPAALNEPNLSIYTGRLPELSMIMFNLNDPQSAFLQNADVRKGLYMGINRQYIANKVLNGQALLANGPIFPGTWAYYDGIAPVDYNPERAVQNLVNAGYTMPADGGTTRVDSSGNALSFTLLYPDDDQHLALAQAIQSEWQDMGVTVNLEAVAYDDLVNNRLTNHDFQAALVDLNLTNLPDPDPYPFWDSVQATGGQNYSQWSNKIASEYLEGARTTTNMDDRIRYYRNFQVVFSEDQPALPLFYPVYNYGVDQAVQGVRMGPLLDPSDRFDTVTKWYLVANSAGTAAGTSAATTAATTAAP